MTGAEATAAASEFSMTTLVCLIMMAGCAFGMALGFPWHWIVGATVLFLLASGYPGTAVAVLGVSITVVFYAPRALVWLSSLDIGRQANDHDARTQHQRRASGRRRKTRENSGHEEFFEQASGHTTSASSPSSGPSPENILGLAGTFTMKELDVARRKLAKKFHPDLHRTAPAGTQKKMAAKMRVINAAYETLKARTA